MSTYTWQHYNYALPEVYFQPLQYIEGRNPDGSGNNLANPEWGKSHEHFLRVTENSYLDGIGFQWDLPVQNTGLGGIPPNPPEQVGTMPAPRQITDTIMAQPAGVDIPNRAGVNEYFQFFGQFLTHDLAEAELVGPAVPADAPPLFLDGLPFPFQRTPGEIVDGVRQQGNDETSFLDLSNVYGSSQAIEDLLRGNVDENGSTVKSAYLLNGTSALLLPTFQEVADEQGVSLDDVKAVLDPNAFGAPDGGTFAAGDNRANQQPQLLSHQTLWKNNHNWHVDQLEVVHPDWTQEQLFEAARALNEADWQSVIFNEYLPRLVGAHALSEYAGYQPDVNPTIINEWTTVAFRFGHDQSSDDLAALEEDGTLPAGQPVPVTLGEAFALGADGVRTDDALNYWIRGQLARPTQEIDGKVVEGNRNLLFGLGAIVDLEVFDIQRGRDHGVGRYNKLREGLGLEKYDSIDEFAAENGVDDATRDALKSIYGEDGIDLVDSIIGGLLEQPVYDAMLGETFTILNVMQFEALRDGDRFFYLNRFADQPDLLKMFEATSLADIVARNSGIDHVYRDAFAAHDRIGGTDANDGLRGGDGVDLLIGFDGNDRLYGRGGDDDLYGDAGNDRLFGRDGDDLLVGGEGHDWLYGGNGDDGLHGGSGRDKISGDRGDDYARGGDDYDRIWGGAGDDFLFGDNGNDRIWGQFGRDLVDGGKGNDWLYGGVGRDIFAFGKHAGQDTVFDFQRIDKLDLSALGFSSFEEVQEAAHRTWNATTIELDDYGAQVKLRGVTWSLDERHVILDDGYLA